MVRYIQTHLEIAKWKTVADDFFKRMQDEGRIADDPDPPTTGEHVFFAIDGEDEPVGMSVFFYPDKHKQVWLHLLYVDPAYRRQGIGRELIRLTVEAGKLNGLVRIGLGAPFKNSEVIRLAQRSGIAPSGFYKIGNITDEGGDE